MQTEPLGDTTESKGAVFNPPPELMAALDPGDAPRLIVFVDTEEEFSWDSFSRDSTAVTNIAHQHRAQAVLGRFGVVPTYLVDYPVATQPDGVMPLKDMLESGACGIGAQLHGWVNPPFEEIINERNTYQSNLPVALESAKIAQLTKAIEDNFKIKPAVFKAGRNGIGRNTVAALVANGYTVDNSVLPYADRSPDGPDFTGSPRQPFWLDGERRLLEIPMTVGLLGALHGIGDAAARTLFSKPSESMKIPGVLARCRLLERIRLTPEGTSISDAKRLTLGLMGQGRRLFVLCYHSSSLLPGSTAYVRDGADLSRFLAWLEEYLEFFFGALGGRATTAEAILSEARRHAPVGAGG